MRPLAFAFPDVERAIPAEDAEWLVAELLATDEAGSVLAARLQQARAAATPLETSPAEKWRLVQIFERSSHPRARDLRGLEIALHAAVYAPDRPEPSSSGTPNPA